jgi:hypothetical protein
MRRSRFLWIVRYAGMCALIAVAACAVVPVAHRLNAPATLVACHEVGVSSIGKWATAVQAYLKDRTCSDLSAPISFKVVNKYSVLDQ